MKRPKGVGKRWITILAGLLLLTGGVGACLPSASAQPNKGAADIVLDGGKTGPVPFPHHRHQTVLAEDCKICHDTFPQRLGSISEMKAGGELKSKEVMNKLCTSCHKEKQRANEKTGPVSCKKCHIKN